MEYTIDATQKPAHINTKTPARHRASMPDKGSTTKMVKKEDLKPEEFKKEAFKKEDFNLEEFKKEEFKKEEFKSEEFKKVEFKKRGLQKKEVFDGEPKRKFDEEPKGERKPDDEPKAMPKSEIKHGIYAIENGLLKLRLPPRPNLPTERPKSFSLGEDFRSELLILQRVGEPPILKPALGYLKWPKNPATEDAGVKAVAEQFLAALLAKDDDKLSTMMGAASPLLPEEYDSMRKALGDAKPTVEKALMLADQGEGLAYSTPFTLYRGDMGVFVIRLRQWGEKWMIDAAHSQQAGRLKVVLTTFDPRGHPPSNDPISVVKEVLNVAVSGNDEQLSRLLGLPDTAKSDAWKSLHNAKVKVTSVKLLGDARAHAELTVLGEMGSKLLMFLVFEEGTWVTRALFVRVDGKPYPKPSNDGFEDVELKELLSEPVTIP